MPSPTLKCIPLLLLAASVVCHAQSFVDLDFSHNVQPASSMYPNNSSLGPNYYAGQTFQFRNVTAGVDAVVTVASTSGSYDLIGWIPNYNHQYGANNGNLGAYSAFTGTYPDPTSPAVGGVTYQITFYVGGEALLAEERFQTQVELSAFRFLVYDHDGEPTQSEAIRTFYSDGFTGYQVRNGSGITTGTNAESVTFYSRGSNHSETDDSGSFIAYYENTSSISFELLASTTHGATGPLGGYGNTYGIFTAFDGSLNLIDGNTSNFGALVPVPEPSGVLLFGLAAMSGLIRRKR